MAHPNADLLHRGYDAFATGDIPTALGMFANDITWHVPGRSPLSGDYKGHEEVLGFFAKSMALSGGTLANRDRGHPV
jgi:ketosteroid isomerase-like protein